MCAIDGQTVERIEYVKTQKHNPSDVPIYIYKYQYKANFIKCDSYSGNNRNVLEQKLHCARFFFFPFFFLSEWH